MNTGTHITHIIHISIICIQHTYFHMVQFSCRLYIRRDVCIISRTFRVFNRDADPTDMLVRSSLDYFQQYILYNCVYISNKDRLCFILNAFKFYFIDNPVAAPNPHSMLTETRDTEILLNPLRAKFFTENKNVYSHFTSFLHIEMIQVATLPQVRQELTDFI